MRKLFLIVILVGILAAPVCALDIDKVRVNLLAGDYKAAITEGEKIVAHTSSRAQGLDELYYILALSYMKDDNLLRASDIFEIIIKEYKDSKFKEEAMMGLGDTYLLRHDYASARKTYNQILEANPGTKLKSQLLYRLSQADFKNGDLEQGKVYLGKVQEQTPLATELKRDKEEGAISEDISSVTYSVQVGAFSKRENAKSLLDKLLSKEYPAYIEEPSGGSKAVFRVKVGRLKAKADAEALRKQLTKDGYPTKLCP
jgi:tetratricopeptide (TPR) repeat protein